MASLAADPTLSFYLRAQGLVVLAFAAFIGLGCAIVPLFSGAALRAGDAAWLLLGTGACVVFAGSGLRTLAVTAPPLEVREGVLQVGTQAVVLDAATRFDFQPGSTALPLPEPGKRGYAAMPSGVDFPPRFAGGPTVRVCNGPAHVSFQPLLYGPAGFITSARPEAHLFISALLQHGTEGDAREWLARAFTADPSPEPAPVFRTFVIFFACVATPVLGLLASAVALGVWRRLGAG